MYTFHKNKIMYFYGTYNFGLNNNVLNVKNVIMYLYNFKMQLPMLIRC